MTNTTQYPKDMSFIDREGKLVIPNKEEYNKIKSAQKKADTNETYSATAYAFFNTRASLEVLPAVIEDAREMYQTPSNLELTLTEGFESLRKDKRFETIIADAKEMGLKYLLKGEYKGATNQQTAGELSSILEGIYNGAKGGDETFEGGVFYENNEKFITRN